MGLGSNLACRNGVSPDNRNMANCRHWRTASLFPDGSIALSCQVGTPAIWIGSSSCDSLGRINNLRLGEAILMGREPLYRNPIQGLHTDAISLVAEVIECKLKPSKSWGTIAQSAFNNHLGRYIPSASSQRHINQAILAIGRQDTRSGRAPATCWPGCARCEQRSSGAECGCEKTPCWLECTPSNSTTARF